MNGKEELRNLLRNSRCLEHKWEEILLLIIAKFCLKLKQMEESKRCHCKVHAYVINLNLAGVLIPKK